MSFLRTIKAPDLKYLRSIISSSMMDIVNLQRKAKMLVSGINDGTLHLSEASVSSDRNFYDFW
jgi:hypothetical protein